MTEIKRYGCDVYYDRGMYECSRGEFSSYADHAEIVAKKDAFIAKKDSIIAELQEQVRALAAENSALARYFSASSVAVNHWNSWADTEYKLACAPETPAADAVVREIRKQAVDGFSEFCGDNSVFIQATCNYDSLADAAYIYLARISAGEQP